MNIIGETWFLFDKKKRKYFFFILIFNDIFNDDDDDDDNNSSNNNNIFEDFCHKLFISRHKGIRWITKQILSPITI